MCAYLTFKSKMILMQVKDKAGRLSAMPLQDLPRAPREVVDRGGCRHRSGCQPRRLSKCEPGEGRRIRMMVWFFAEGGGGQRKGKRVWGETSTRNALQLTKRTTLPLMGP